MKKLLLTLSLVVSLAFASVAFAETSTSVAANLQAQINTILAQIQKLQLQLNAQAGVSTTVLPVVPTTSTSASDGFCFAFVNNLRIGDQNPDVTNLYRALIAEGLFDKDEAFQDGRQVLYFSERLASAVSEFQEKYASEVLAPAGLKRGTGYVGPSTRAKLNALYPCSKTIPPVECPLVYGSDGVVRHECSTNSQSPVINGVSGPQSLTVNQQGTWTVKASDPSGGALSYSVIWGDSTSVPMATGENGFPSASTFTQTATFTHTYTQAGSFYPQFFVRNNVGTQGTGLSVNVVGVKTASSITVSRPNGGEAWTKGTTQTISWNDTSNNLPAGCNQNGLYCMPPVPRSYDIKLIPYCIGTCTAIPHAPYTIASNVYSNSYYWNVGSITYAYATQPNPTTIVPDGAYTIQVCQTGISVCDSSDSYFKIISGVAQPSITVLSPNGGETFTQGSLLTGSFTTSNIAYGTFCEAAIVGRKSDGSPVDATIATLSMSATDKQVYSGTIPANLVPPGSYRIRVDCGGGVLIAQDQSDNSFTITTPTNSTTPTAYLSASSGNKTVSSSGSNSTTGVLTVNVGDVVSYTWNTNGTSATSGYTVSGGADPCGWYPVSSGPNYPWVAHDTNGSYSMPNAIQSCQAGHTYYITYKGTNSAGSNSATVAVVVNPVVSSQPTITVTSPNGGETLTMGKTYTASWTSSGVSSVMVDLVRPGYECHLTNGDVSNTGSLNFSLTSCVNGLAISPATDYKIVVMYRSNAAIVTKDESNSYFTIMTTSTLNNQSPIIDSITGPTAVGVNQAGTWNVKATDPESGNHVVFGVNWGDGSISANTFFSSTDPKYALATLSHTYTQAGAYTITFSVDDGDGGITTQQRTLNAWVVGTFTVN
ncbi:MAG: PKD domain-containing protein [Patescibacteria group bacterium]